MPEWTADEAREMASRGGQVTAMRRRAAKAVDPMKALRDELEADGPSYLTEMKAAAAGTGDYAKLNPKDRMAANRFLLELAYGRPVARRVPDPSEPDDDQAGFSLQVGPGPGE